MAHWIQIGERTYECSNCRQRLTTSYPIEQWTRCPFCHSEMEAADGDSDTEKNS